MTKEMTIKYSIVKTVSLSDALESSSKAATHERSADKLSGGVWNQTVIAIMENLDLTSYSVGNSKENIQAIREVLFTTMEQAIGAAGIVIPETGNDRDGKTITLINEKTGKVRWSSWDKTRRIFAYLGDIAKVLSCDKGDVLYPEKNKVAARCDILQECGKTGTAMEHVQRLTKQLGEYLPALDDSDKIDASGLLNTLRITGLDPVVEVSGLITRLDAIILSSSTEQKEDIKALIFALGTRHYV